MNVQDLLKNPQLFAVKCGYLMAEHADCATIVPVTIVETAPEGTVN